jgi:G3E family GTPase
MTAPLPVTVLTGFLGAGKTTLLQRLLAAPHGRRIGVILNELGQTGIEPVPGAFDQIKVDLDNGCVCCVRSDDLVAALETMRARGDVDLVILETTGVADPLALTWTLGRPDMAELCRLDAVVTVVDAASFERTQTPEWIAQVTCADLLVVAKLDVAPDDALPRLRARLAELGTSQRVVDARAELPVDVLLDVSPDPAALQTRASAAGPEARHTGYRAASFTTTATYDAGRLEDWLETLPDEIYRAKGIVRVGPARWFAFHTVGGRMDVDPDAPAPAHGESRLVFIGRALEREPLAAALAACEA